VSPNTRQSLQGLVDSEISFSESTASMALDDASDLSFLDSPQQDKSVVTPLPFPNHEALSPKIPFQTVPAFPETTQTNKEEAMAKQDTKPTMVSPLCARCKKELAEEASGIEMDQGPKTSPLLGQVDTTELRSTNRKVQHRRSPIALEIATSSAKTPSSPKIKIGVFDCSKKFFWDFFFPGEAQYHYISGVEIVILPK